MSRRQQRAELRAAAKALKQKRIAGAPLGDTAETSSPLVKALNLRYEDLNERQQRGVELWARAQAQNGLMLFINDDQTIWFSQSDNTRAYSVVRAERNDRGTMVIEYRCVCPDFSKYGRPDCKHIFAERLRRGDVIIETPIQRLEPQKTAARRPSRRRSAHDGRTVRSAQRSARRKMPVRIPELALSLKRALDLNPTDVIIPIRSQNAPGGRNGAPASTRATALLSKVACGLSASEMVSEYERMIQDGTLRIRRAPSENTLTDWMNDERLTPVLRQFLRLSALPFREREIGAIIDSSKVSQLMTAHYKEVEYNNHDRRPNADWMKAHTLVGVETLVVMAVEFSGVYGPGTHDMNFLEQLVTAALETFPLEYLLGDKAYLSEDVPGWLADHGLRAVIPIKKRWFRDGKKAYHEALAHPVEWYDRNDNRDFHEVYRLRSKVECLFSVLKRMADGYCWSRGRKREIKNANEPCTAWMNELLCKFIYTNLRMTVELEEETGVKIDYLIPSRRFPIPDEPLLSRRAA